LKIIITTLIFLHALLAKDSLDNWGIWDTNDNITLSKKSYTLEEALEILEPRATMVGLINDIQKDAWYSKDTTKKYKNHVQYYGKKI